MQCKGDIEKIWQQIDLNLCDIYLMAGSGDSEFNQGPFEDFYEVGEEIGSGQFAKVFKCRHKESGVEYAGKFIRKRRTRSSRRGVLMEDIRREIAILQEINHENIIRLYQVYENKQSVILVLELVSGGELFEYLSKIERVSEEGTVAFLKQILAGVKYLHDKNIIHLDLKPENILLSSRDSTKIKLIDFGLSRKLKDGEVVKEMLGTPEFVAPEVINYDPLHTASDMWSIGVITYILLTGCSPFLGDDKQETFVNVCSNNYSLDPQLFASTSELATDFIKKLLVRQPEKRLTATDCLNHPWIQPTEEEQVVERRRSVINTENLASFVARRRWKQSIKVVMLCNKWRDKAKVKSRDDKNEEMNGAASDSDPLSSEEDEENFVLTSLLTAVEEGNLPGVKELLETAENFDVNSSNKHGETALHLAAGGGHLDIIEYLSSKGIDLHVSDKHGDSVTYWAARQGHVHVILYLKDQGVSLNAQNKAGEAPIHVAARYGHINVIEFLCKAEEADVNLQDKLGETALHNAAWHGLPSLICLQLCSAGCHLDKPNKEGETPLHCASARGNVDCVRVLIKTGASLNVPDKRGSTALHLACRRHHVNIAVLLLHSGCQFDVVDQQFETPLHIAAREGLLPVVQTLCAFGCRLDASNKIGLTPMHLASRGGFAEVVRCLLLSGAEPDLPNKDGVTAEIMALAQGHSDVAELLTRLKPERREVFMRQLIPTNTMLGRIKLKIFGNSGVGKTTLVDSLKCGYFGSFFRKARLSSSNSVGHNMENGTSSPKHHSLPSQLSYEVVNGGYTKGIDVQQINISGCGDLSVWDFGGYEPYFMTYDHFIGDPNCIHMVVFSLTEPESIQLAQITFWLDFLKSRIPPFEPVSQQGKSPWPAKVILVGTHADKAPNIIKKPSGEYECPDVVVILTAVQEKYQYDFDISKQIFVADAHLAMSPDLKSLRMHLGDVKAAVVKSLPTSNGFLDAVVQTLPAWRKTTANFPVLPWPNFIEFVRSRINTLASEDHMKELMHQLQLLGEVVYLETEQANDLVILCPRWLCTDIIGQLLSHERIMHCRPTGCFTVDDFQLMFPETEAADLLKVLEALEICTECMIDGDPEYEFPCLNFVETLHGLWEKDVKRYPNAVYGGVRLNCPHGMTNQLVHMFPRIQVQLRRNILADQHNPDTDLYQWYQGSKYCIGSMEALLTIEQSDQVVEIKVRGPQDMRTNLYYFFEEMVEIVEQFLDECCPGFQLEKHLLSPSHLKQHCKTVHSYAPKTLLQMQLEGRDALQLDEDVEEDFIDVACFGSQEIRDGMTPGTDLHISNLNIHTRRLLSQRLDPPDAMGRDWCLLAVSLGLTDNLPKLEDSKRKCESATDRTLEEWSHDTSASIAVLIAKLEELGRNDVVDCILNSGPLWRVYHEDPSQDSGVITAPSHSSNNTLSSVS